VNTDPQILRLFAGQHGVATTAQLAAAGVSARTVHRATARGTLIPILPRVHRLAAHPENFFARAMAVLLCCGPDCFLTGSTAGALRGLGYMPREIIRASTFGRLNRRLPSWTQISETGWLAHEDIITLDTWFQVAGPGRMLLALAAEFNQFAFERAAEDAWKLNLISPADAAAYVEGADCRGLRGMAAMRRWLDKAVTRERPSQSGLEMNALQAIRIVGLPEPERQFPLVLLTGEIVHIDIAWPAIKFGVEPGHTWWHGGDLKQEADQTRDSACGEVGWHVIRFTQSMRRDLRAAGLTIRRNFEARRRADTHRSGQF